MSLLPTATDPGLLILFGIPTLAMMVGIVIFFGPVSEDKKMKISEVAGFGIACACVALAGSALILAVGFAVRIAHG